VIIFDWDDTLLCTSYITRQGAVEMSPDEIEVLARLDDSAVIFNGKVLMP
jgi:acid phosphatase class B